MNLRSWGICLPHVSRVKPARRSAHCALEFSAYSAIFARALLTARAHNGAEKRRVNRFMSREMFEIIIDYRFMT